jgi:ABC-type sugar transport system ATPase subunit
MPPAVRVHDLWKSYTAGVAGCSARVWALRGCTLQMDAGERIAVVGRRGSGKTTLLRCLAGDRRVDAGRIDVALHRRQYVTSIAQVDQLAADAAPTLLLVDDEPVRGTFRIHVSVRAVDAVIVAARDVACVQGVVDRVLLLSDGRLTPFTRTIVRQVAEHRRRA